MRELKLIGLKIVNIVDASQRSTAHHGDARGFPSLKPLFEKRAQISGAVKEG